MRTNRINRTLSVRALGILALLMPGCGTPEVTYITQPIFVNQGNGAVLDTRTGNLWQAGALTESVEFVEATAYCDELDLAGRSDWSLPTELDYTELISSSTRTCSASHISKVQNQTLDDKEIIYMDFNGSITECNMGVPFFDLPEIYQGGEIIPYKFWAQTVKLLNFAVPIASVFSTENYQYLSSALLYTRQSTRCVIRDQTTPTGPLDFFELTPSVIEGPPNSIVEIRPGDGELFPEPEVTKLTPYYFLAYAPMNIFNLRLVEQTAAVIKVNLPILTPGTTIEIFIVGQSLEGTKGNFEINKPVYTNSIQANLIEVEDFFMPATFDANLLGTWVQQEILSDGEFIPYHKTIFSNELNTLIFTDSTVTEEGFIDSVWPSEHYDWGEKGLYTLNAQDGQIWAANYDYQYAVVGTSVDFYYIDYAMDLTNPNLLWISKNDSSSYSSPISSGTPYCREGYDC